MSDDNHNHDPSFQALCVHSERQPLSSSCCPHHHPEKLLFVQLGGQQGGVSDIKKNPTGH